MACNRNTRLEPTLGTFSRNSICELRSFSSVPKIASFSHSIVGDAIVKQQRKTFREILLQEAPRIARRLEIKARLASKLAKIQPVNASTLYSLKYCAVRELFRLPGHSPLIRDAWTAERGILLSIKLNGTDSWLHVPFHVLNVAARNFYGPWVARRARGNPWQSTQTIHRSPIGRGRTRPSWSAQ